MLRREKRSKLRVQAIHEQDVVALSREEREHNQRARDVDGGFAPAAADFHLVLLPNDNVVVVHDLHNLAAHAHALRVDLGVASGGTQQRPQLCSSAAKRELCRPLSIRHWSLQPNIDVPVELQPSPPPTMNARSRGILEDSAASAIATGLGLSAAHPGPMVRRTPALGPCAASDGTPIAGTGSAAGAAQCSPVKALLS